MVTTDRAHCVLQLQAAMTRLRAGQAPRDQLANDIVLVTEFEKVLGDQAEPADFESSEQELIGLINKYRTLVPEKRM